jgi:hypothetical protein
MAAKRVIFPIGEEYLRRDGLSETPVVWEDGLRADTGPGSFEWWYFDAHCKDGSTAVIVYATKPLLERRGPLKPNLALTITRPDGVKLGRFVIYPAGQFSASQERCDVKMGPGWARGDLHTYALHAEGNGLAADLVFNGTVPPWRPGAGKNYYDEALTRYFAWLAAIPFGTVEGTLTYDGQTHIVHGIGYHDHNWGNIGLDEVMSHWYWGRAHIGEFNLIFIEMTSAADYGSARIPVFLFTKGGQILVEDGRPLKLQVGDIRVHPGGREYPNQVDIHWQNETGSVHIALRLPQMIEGTSLLGLLPRWKRPIARLFANPYYFRFNADLELSVELPSVHALERGRALYEIMLLK